MKKSKPQLPSQTMKPIMMHHAFDFSRQLTEDSFCILWSNSSINEFLLNGHWYPITNPMPIRLWLPSRFSIPPKWRIPALKHQVKLQYHAVWIFKLKFTQNINCTGVFFLFSFSRAMGMLILYVNLCSDFSLGTENSQKIIPSPLGNL